MEIRKSYVGMIKNFPGGWDAMAAALSLSRNALENRIYEHKGQSLLVETALQLQTFSRTTYFAEAVAAASGGTFLKLPENIPTDDEPLLKKFNTLYAQLGTFSKHFGEATEDNRINKRERADLTAIGDDMQRTIVELLALTFRIYCEDAKSSAAECVL